jgi:hypothetical protein
LDDRPHHLVAGLLDHRGQTSADLELTALPDQPQPNLGGFHDPHGVSLHRAEAEELMGGINRLAGGRR